MYSLNVYKKEKKKYVRRIEIDASATAPYFPESKLLEKKITKGNGTSPNSI